MANQVGGVQADVLRRIEAIATRLEAFNLRAREILQSATEEKYDPEDRIRHLEVLESKLGELEDRLRWLEEQMRIKESPPQTFGTEARFSTGTHYPGLG